MKNNLSHPPRTQTHDTHGLSAPQKRCDSHRIGRSESHRHPRSESHRFYSTGIGTKEKRACLIMRHTLFIISITVLNTVKLYSSEPIIFQMPAAMAAPANGPTINTQSSLRACPPWKIAGPMERAGFTEVPV